jgi:hypothetical protein
MKMIQVNNINKEEFMMGDNKNNKNTKTGPEANNDQLGENAYEPYSEKYDNKGKNAKAQK